MAFSLQCFCEMTDFFPSFPFKKCKNVVVESGIFFSCFHPVSESWSPDTPAESTPHAHVLDVVCAVPSGRARVPHSVP